MSYVIQLQSFSTIFSAVGDTAFAALNNLKTDRVGTYDVPIQIASNNFFSDPITGIERIGNIHNLYQGLSRFNVPLGKITKINFIKLTFEMYEFSNLGFTPNLNLNVFAVKEIKRHTSAQTYGSNSIAKLIKTLPLVDGSVEIDVPLALVQGDYNFRVMFFLDGFPIIQDGDFFCTQTSSPILLIDCDYGGLGADVPEHYESDSSGFSQSKGANPVYSNQSGFVVKNEKAQISSLRLFSGSGHELKLFDTCCENRVLRFNNLGASFTRQVDLTVDPSHLAKTEIILYQWNEEPNAYPTSQSFSVIYAFNGTSNSFSLSVPPGLSWFHFGQINPETGVEQPIRIYELSGKLLLKGF